jgi:hypothetical protein
MGVSLGSCDDWGRAKDATRDPRTPVDPRVLAVCGGQKVAGVSAPVPPSATYGSGSWAFTVSFLAKPSRSGVRAISRRDASVVPLVLPDTYPLAP